MSDEDKDAVSNHSGMSKPPLPLQLMAAQAKLGQQMVATTIVLNMRMWGIKV